jgi:rSAM-associated Gly-rich repeat protein
VTAIANSIDIFQGDDPVKISTKVGLVGLLMALSTLTTQSATAKAHSPSNNSANPTAASIDSRLSRISAALRETEGALSGPAAEQVERLHAVWLKGSGGGWVNRTWGNGGWRDGGGFFNNRGGGGFLNNRGGGGFLNSR